MYYALPFSLVAISFTSSRARRYALLSTTCDHFPDRVTSLPHGVAGHDTVIAPLLAALGGTSSGDSVFEDTCFWPPYASRIVFELWQAPSMAKVAYLRASVSCLTQQPLPPSSPPVQGGRQHGQASVRLLFNGKPITHRVAGCAEASERLQLCPLPTFARAVSELVRPHENFEQACLEKVS